jgi:DNA (cytosine-5)-methyltransferase 1
MPDFASWISFLDGLGYHSKYEVLNAKDYGIPQNRQRCFMVSWLGDFYYSFPEPIPLKNRLSDVLDDDVDEKYYVDMENASLSSHIINVERERERDGAHVTLRRPHVSRQKPRMGSGRRQNREF